jgi:predicted nuclease of predicted toxin-antitoxin system
LSRPWATSRAQDGVIVELDLDFAQFAVLFCGSESYLLDIRAWLKIERMIEM